MPNFRKLQGTTESQLWVAKEATGSTYSGVYLENTNGANLDVKEPSGGGTLANISIAAPTLDAHASTKKYVDDSIGGVDQARWIHKQVTFADDGVAASGTPNTVVTTAEIPQDGVVIGVRVNVTTAWDKADCTMGISADSTVIAVAADLNIQQADMTIVDLAEIHTPAAHAVEITMAAPAIAATQGSAEVYIIYVETPAI
jgi:hypothetical protein